MEKTKRKFNLIDLFVVVAIVAVVAFVLFKLNPFDMFAVDTDGNGPATYEITFYTEESTTYSLERIEVEDLVSDESNNIKMGKVIEKPELKESEATLETADGRYVVAPREGYSSTYIKFVGEGVQYPHGAKFEKGQYSVGQTVTLRVGDSKVYGRIHDIKVVG